MYSMHIYVTMQIARLQLFTLVWSQAGRDKVVFFNGMLEDSCMSKEN